MNQSSIARFSLLALGALAFSLLVLLNVGGYRYGVSDQAFYIPAILRHINPELFPHDASLLDAQDLLLTFDNLIAGLAVLSGSPLPSVFIVSYFGALVLFFIGMASIGTSLYRSPWSATALITALTLRHRITATAVNTQEAYLHPRMLAFALGLGAVAALLRGRPLAALAIAGASAVFHPTTALWFVVWVGVAVWVAEPARRRPLAVLAAALAGTALAVFIGPMRARLGVMDEVWLSVLASKDYLFPTAWPLAAWLANLSYVVMIGTVYRSRRRRGLTSVYEDGLVIGCGVLLLIFLASLPPTARAIAFAVQLQTSRIFWMLDMFASVYLIWVIAEGPLARRSPAALARWPRMAVAVFALAALGRGGYVMFVEQAARPLIQFDLGETDWAEAMRWIAATPPATHVLADPAHGWRYGSTVRVAGQRDVYVEEVKDSAVAIYSRDVAYRIARRIEDLGDFHQLTAERARWLAARYDLDYLVTEHALALPELHRSGAFRVYALRQ